MPAKSELVNQIKKPQFSGASFVGIREDERPCSLEISHNKHLRIECHSEYSKQPSPVHFDKYSAQLNCVLFQVSE